ncbi:isopentenyl-diphosphate Delta-isomerase [Streptomyces sp. uw30]|uniref:isopentenyl-diphosphate Delta-isomerase n=1 Tax=Streptomyces sp. uw30 TaxID=1828179 RepID=UPI0021C88FF3|nr:isopentenyl-diphosphate Delta-isomerase [Streptomyces sp. uw30]
MDDPIVLLDEGGHAIGTAPKPASHHRDTPLHLAFTAYAFSPSSELLLTRRSAAKKTWPGVWTNTVCGHPRPHEPLPDAVRRRVHAELGAGGRCKQRRCWPRSATARCCRTGPRRTKWARWYGSCRTGP